MSEVTYKVGNWSAYNQALRERGSLTVWISEEAVDQWKYDGPTQQGAQPTYSDLAIETCLTLGLVYDLPFRQTQGFAESLFRLMGVDLPVPDYSTLSRRKEDLSVNLCAGGSGAGGSSAGGSGEEGEPSGQAPGNPEGKHIVIDSTGLKVYGEGEWKQRQHGKSKRRTWRKIHIGVDTETGEITATKLTENNKHDSSQVEALLEETLGQVTAISRVGGDGAYDTWGSYEAISEAGAEPIIPPQKNAKIKKHGNSKGPPLARDEAIRYIRGHGRKKWKREHDYHRRSLVESVVRRIKTIVGRVLKARKLSGQRTEARLSSKILNRMTQLGMPESYAVVVA